ncbi:MAG: prefoldin subunit [Candidatus Diapherotrites archaeon]|nr:prefoldin subunit [Candidatus Diapherotrites archaeon]
MNEEEQRAAILDFERNRQLLGSISSQKQQISMQLELISASLEELSKNKEKTVFKVVGNVLFQKDAKEMEKELIEKKENYDLRLKTVIKQEENLIKKLKSIQSKIEEEMKNEKEKQTQPETKIEKKKK